MLIKLYLFSPSYQQQAEDINKFCLAPGGGGGGGGGGGDGGEAAEAVKEEEEEVEEAPPAVDSEYS